MSQEIPIRKRPSARRDLVSQWVWYAEHSGIETADRFLAAIESTLQLLSAHPESGAPVETTRPELHGLRRFPLSGGFSMILLFYQASAPGIDLLRVLHASRDIRSTLEPDLTD